MQVGIEQSLKDRPEMLKGRIEVIIGPMFSGKTSELMRRIRRYTAAEKRAIVIKYARDNRHDNANMHTLTTHDGDSHIAVAWNEKELWINIASLCEEYDIIGIDEGQFFIKLFDSVDFLSRNGKTVIVAALNGTFQQKLFGETHLLMCIADSFQNLTAICKRCKGEAVLSKRLEERPGEGVEVIAAKDRYEARCRACFNY